MVPLIADEVVGWRALPSGLHVELKIKRVDGSEVVIAFPPESAPTLLSLSSQLRPWQTDREKPGSQSIADPVDIDRFSLANEIDDQRKLVLFLRTETGGTAVFRFSHGLGEKLTQALAKALR